MASQQATEFAEFLADLQTRSSNPNIDLPTTRDIIESSHVATKEPEGVSYAEVNAGGVEALWCIPTDSDEHSALLHSHMGGAVVGSMYSDRKAAAHIAKAAGVRSLVLNYRRSPDFKFPAQNDDVDTAYRWLLDQGYGPSNIASVGHSIGGNFAISLALRLRDANAALPAAIVSISPWIDMTVTSPTIEVNNEADKMLSRGLLETFRSLWLDDTGVEWNDARVSLLNADLSGLPPTAIYWGADELLAGEAEQLAQRLHQAGNDLLAQSVPAGQHSFIVAAGRVPEADHAVNEIGQWLRAKLGLTQLAVTGT